MPRREDDEDREPIKVRGNCWLCDGTGRVIKHGCTKSVACSECKGTGYC